MGHRRRRGAVVAEHDIGVEHGQQRAEVAVAQRGEEGIDDLPLPGEIGLPGGAVPWTRLRARLASWRAAAGERSRMAAISSNGTAKMSCRTKASRSAGARMSSTTISAGPTESASRAWAPGRWPPPSAARP